MNKYTPISSFRSVYACDTCRALVVDTDGHDRWHKELEFHSHVQNRDASGCVYAVGPTTGL